MYLTHGHNAVPSVGLVPEISRSGVKHYTTEPLHYSAGLFRENHNTVHIANLSQGHVKFKDFSRNFSFEGGNHTIFRHIFSLW